VGTFTIPAITVAGAGSSSPLNLRVEKGSGGQTQHGATRGHSPLPAPAFPSSPDDTSASSHDKPAFLRVIIPKQSLVVGELVPVQIKAYFRAGVSASLNGLPVLSSDAFTLNKLGDDPEQTRENVDGKLYSVVTWTSSLAAVKAGDYPLNLDLPVMLRIKEKSRGGKGHNPFKDFFGDDSPFGDSPFEDSFFDDFFGQAVEKPMTLHTDGAVVKIKPLPSEGRPADFTGAVGQFDLKSDASSKSGVTGDPLTLKMRVIGYGNFDRVATAGLPTSAEWKTYKPNSKFEPGDSANTSGTKTFEQAVVPLKTGAQNLPPWHFSYFDPDTGKYVSKSAPPVAVQVAKGSAPVLSPNNSSAKAAAPETEADGLIADQAVSPGANASLHPLVLRPWFITVNALMVLALALVAIFRRLMYRRGHDERRLRREAAEKSLREAVAAMDAAMKSQDAPRFFHAARRALQERLADQWQVPVSSVTIPEITSRLNGRAGKLRSVLEAADEITYSGQQLTLPDLQLWREVVGDELHEISRL
jgi:hypothetical protein